MNATAQKPKLGDQRYLAVWCDTRSLYEAARKAGWTHDTGSGALDFVEANDHEIYLRAPSFEAAVSIAQKKVSVDYWGCPRVYLQEFGPADVPASAREWEDVKFWDIEADGTATEQSV